MYSPLGVGVIAIKIKPNINRDILMLVMPVMLNN